MNRVKLSSVAIFVTVLWSAQSANGTSIAIVLSGNSLAIVTDSQRTTGQLSRSVCKISKAGDLYFVPVVLGEPWAITAIKSSLLWMGNIDQRIAHSINTMKPLLEKQANSNLALVELAEEQGDLALEVNVMGYENGKARLNLIKYHLLKENGNYRIKPENKPILDPGLSIGPTEDRYIFDRFIAQGYSPLLAAEKFVQAEIDRKVPTVGGPVEALAIDSMGKATWAQRPKVCDEQP